MLPLTPPNDYPDSFDASVEVINRDVGVTLIESSQYSAHQDDSIATPISNSNMGMESLESMDVRDIGERSDSQELSDEDQQMSDGGVDISGMSTIVILPLEEGQVNSSNMEMPESAEPGHPDFEAPFQSTFFQPTSDDDIPYHPLEQPHEQAYLPYYGEDESDNPAAAAYASSNLGAPEISHTPHATSSLPTVMSELSQQLQHIQDGQEHADFGAGPDPQSWAIDNSIPPFPLPFQSFMDLENYGDLSSLEFSHQNTHMSSVSAALDDASHSLQLIDLITPGELPNLITPAAQTSASMSPSHEALAANELFYFHYPPDPNWDEEVPASEADQIEVEDQFNLSLGDFLTTWSRTMDGEEDPRRRLRARWPSLPAVSKQRDLTDLEPMEPRYLQGDHCDIQRIDWDELGVTRLEAREMRRQTYKNYTNLRTHRCQRNLDIQPVSNHSQYFKFRRMDFDHDVHLSHFQLRNLVACASRDRIYYAGRSQVMHYSPMEGSGLSSKYSIAMDLTQPAIQPFYGSPYGGVQISTMTIAHDILVAGGFCGEYGIVNLKAQKDTKQVEGVITDDSNAITNHVQVHQSRGSSSPLVAFASNDKFVRILDVNTNRVIGTHKYEHAINCSAISPDQRLRVLTGDTRKILICNSETGEVLQELEGHRDYGFACDWADDGWTVATGNQDKLVKIWDARKWKDSQGVSLPVATISADMAGVRKLKFSPLGSGKSVLIAAEPADFVHVIDGETFSNKQTLSFFGEIGGVDFTNNGRDLIIANCDNMRGGIMEYERCGLAGDAYYNSEEPYRHRRGSMPNRQGYDWMYDDQESIRHAKSRRTNTHRSRKAAMIMTDMAYF